MPTPGAHTINLCKFGCDGSVVFGWTEALAFRHANQGSEDAKAIATLLQANMSAGYHEVSKK